MSTSQDIDAAFAAIENAGSRRAIASALERLNFSADTKALLADLAGVVVKVGDRIVSIGKAVLGMALDFIARYPSTTFGVVLGFIIKALIATIPFIGPALGAFFGPIMIAFGLAVGMLEDLRNNALAARVAEMQARLMTIQGAI